MTVRKNISMSEITAKWYEEKAREMGVSQSALMAMALSDYIKQERSINALDELLKQLQGQVQSKASELREWTKEDEENWNEQIAAAYPEKI